MPQNQSKVVFFELIEKIGHHFLLNFVYNESLYYLRYSYKNLIFGKYLVLEIWIEILLANHIVGFCNKLCLLNEMKK